MEESKSTIVENGDEYEPKRSTCKNPKVYPLHPSWLILFTMVAGLAVSGPMSGMMFFRYGYRKLGCILGSLLGLCGLSILLFAFLWDVEWYWAAFSLTGIHLSTGSILFLLLKAPHRRFIKINPLPPKSRTTHHEIIGGMVGGAFTGSLIGTVSTVLYILFADRLFSMFMPIDFVDVFAVTRVIVGGLIFTLAGAIAGGIIGSHKPSISSSQLILYGLILVWAHHTWLLALEVAIAIPGFQAGAATSKGWWAILIPFTLFEFFIGFWWSVLLFFFIVSVPSKLGKLGRALQVAGINLAAGITLCISFGYPADAFLALGRHFEREASMGKALWCYEQGLKKMPEEGIASYLQYHTALLHYRLGNIHEAKQGLKRVITKYTFNKDLIKKSSRFLENLNRSATKKRVVLANAQTGTSYKGGYCVPNSLALVMRYWGSEITSRAIGREITGLGSGTFVVNQRWFAEREDFRHDFLPMASLNDIKSCIDGGFPVLVYVPSHVFAIVGYDEALETFVTYDVATHDVWVEYLQKDFIKAWKKQAATLALAYPPEKEPSIPRDIHKRLIRLSDDYLHFQLHYLDAPTDSLSMPHLMRAAGDTGEFFFPITILYDDFPGVRKTLEQRYNTQRIVDSIQAYFWDDFDEGIHDAGQYHNERWAQPDWALKYSILYLTAQGRFDMVKKLTERIDEEGQVSEEILVNMGMIDIAMGRFEHGLDRLHRAENAKNPLYTALAHLKMGKDQGAIRDLVKIVNRKT
ncbi:MAG: hypothetical protein SWO11_11120 [Thermodesulfobacteriota bacterium]|nr:hypothetical protein [Thermodesulfobacteriota bacterium]